AGDYSGDTSSSVDIEETATSTNRKLIKTVDLTAETKSFDTLLDSVTSTCNSMGGYVESSNINNGSRYNDSTYFKRTAYIVLRIPQNKLQSFLDSVATNCNIVRKNENVTDVTLSYVDLESHKKALKGEEERLLEFLSAAESIDEMITIEDRLTSIRYQLESMESQLRTYDNKIDYSTVSMQIDEVKEYKPAEPEEEPGFWEQISTGFVDSLKQVGNGLKNFVIWFIVNIPYLVVFVVVITIIILIVRKVLNMYNKADGLKAKRAEKKAQREAKKAEMYRLKREQRERVRQERERQAQERQQEKKNENGQ
ncbi:MAG: DUF4349 domain-containing protein, partial [Lachnospiraceae bacterium]|nr:DUF4349 domain-containing protein [Lachnospiraceae bacterium]